MQLQMYTFVVTYANRTSQTPFWRLSTGHQPTLFPSESEGVEPHGLSAVFIVGFMYYSFQLSILSRCDVC